MGASAKDGKFRAMATRAQAGWSQFKESHHEQTDGERNGYDLLAQAVRHTVAGAWWRRQGLG
jgi:hypothetical protein